VLFRSRREEHVMETKRPLTAVFENAERAQQALGELERAGFSRDQIHVLCRDERGKTAEARGGFARALAALGILRDDSEYYEGECQAGRAVLTIQAAGREDEALSILHEFGGSERSGAEARPIQAREERLDIRKKPVQTGEVRVRKEVHEEERNIDVPVQREEVVVERRPGSGREASGPIGDRDQIRIPVREEQLHVEKTPVVNEEVTVGKRAVHESKPVRETVRKEEVKVEEEGGNAPVRTHRK